MNGNQAVDPAEFERIRQQQEESEALSAEAKRKRPGGINPYSAMVLKLVFDERELKLINNCVTYANSDPADLPGHNLMLVVNKYQQVVETLIRLSADPVEVVAILATELAK